MALYDGLATQIQELPLPLDLPPDLDSLIALAVQTNNWVRELAQYRWSRTSAERSPRNLAPGELVPRRALLEPQPQSRMGAEGEPMQLGRAQLSPEERRR